MFTNLRILQLLLLSISAVSGELVHLLQERHDLQEQVEMRRIAIEQLLRLQTEGDTISEVNGINMSVISLSSQKQES